MKKILEITESLFRNSEEKLINIELVSFWLIIIGAIIVMVAKMVDDVDFGGFEYYIECFFEDKYYMPILVVGANYVRSLTVITFLRMAKDIKGMTGRVE